MKFILPLILLFTCGLAGYAQTTASPDAAISEFDVNGLKIIFKRRPNTPTVAAGLFIRGGVRNETAQTAGIENLALDTSVEASKKYPRDLLRKALARTGTVIGSASGRDFSVISMTSTTENLASSWDIYADDILNPTFDAADVDRARSAVLASLRDESSSPDSALDELKDTVIYPGNPYSVDPNGTIETVSKFTPAELSAYYRSLMQTSRLLLVIVGDADTDEITRLVKQSFGALPRGTYKDVAPPKLAFSTPTLQVMQKDLPTNYVKGVFTAPSMGDPDYYAMRVAVAVLQSRVYDEVRLKRNLSYAPNAEMDNLASNSGDIYVTAVDANQAVNVMLNEIGKMRTDLVDPEEFSNIPGFFLTTYYIDQETNASQAAELARYEIAGGGWRNSLNFLSSIEKVTPNDVRDVSAKYMKNLQFVVIGDPKAIDKQVFLKN